MPSFRRWIGFLCLSAMVGLGSTAHAEFPGRQFGRPFPPQRGPIPGGPMMGRPLPPPIFVPRPSLVLLQQLAIHAKNITDEIAATNDVMAVNNGGSVIAPVVLERFKMNPYTRTLIDTNLLFIPPRPRSPVAQGRAVEYMVSWRMADVLQAVDFMVANPNPANMQLLINRFSIAVPSTYLYIEGMRETFLVSPVMSWPNAELPAILCRLEAQILVMRQLMDALYCDATFNPYFPRSWGYIETTFAAYRIDVRAAGPVGIAPFPFYQDGPRGPGGFFTPEIAPVPRQGLNPALPYDPNAWNGNFDRFDTRYVDGNPLPQNPGAVPGIQSALPGAGALPPQGQQFPAGVGGLPQQGGGFPPVGIPGAGGLPSQQGGGQQYGPAYGGPQGQGQPLPGANGNGYDQNGVPGFPGQGGQPQQYGPGFGNLNQQPMQGGQYQQQPQQGNQPQRPRTDQNGQPLQSGNTNGVQWGDFSYDQNAQQNGQQQNSGQYQQQQLPPQQYNNGQYQQPQYQQQQYPQQQQSQLPPEQYPAPRQ